MTETKPVKPEVTEPAAAAAPATPVHTSNKKVFIIIGSLVAVFILIPMIVFIVGLLFVGKNLKDNGVSVNTNSGSESVSIKDKNGNEFSAGGSQTLPKDFPKDFPVYKGDIASSGRLTTDGKTGWTVSVQTNDDLTKVSESLTGSFSSNGWTTSMDNINSQGGLIVASNGTLRSSVFYSTKDGKTTILYTVTNADQAE